jgi:ribonuclease BN (tRNA processing enzyme)
MRIVLLGTGTPTPSLRRMCSGYLVQVARATVVFDHGFGAHHRLLELGIAPTQVTHAFISHHHYDHMGDLARLVLTRWDQGAGRIPELALHGPPPLARIAERLWGDDGAFGPDVISRTRNQASLDVYHARGGEGERAPPRPAIRELAPNEVVQGDGWTVTSAGVAHFGPHLVSYGYRLDSAEGSFVYSGDTGPCSSMARLAQDCDVLVHMCHYLTGTAPSKSFAQSVMGHMELAELAATARAKSLVITHVTEQFDRPGVRERVIADIARVYPGNIIFGEDLLEVPVASPAPAALR